MRFSDEFRVRRTQRDDWFDLVLSVDTKLFIDPFLLYAQERPPFHGSHGEIIDFFNAVFALIARTGGNPRHLGVWPFVLMMLASIVALYFVPDIALYIPFKL